MLTITGLIAYKTTEPLKRAKPVVPQDGKFHYRPSKPGLSPKERMRERRAQAKAQGWCGVCTYRRPRAGFKTCDGCLKSLK